MKFLIVIALLEAILVTHGFAQSTNYVRTDAQRNKVALVKDNPNLGIEYEKVAVLKIASRKKKYRIGEMFNLDIAMMNSSNQKLYFLNLSNSGLYLRSDEGNVVKVFPYLAIERGITASSYSLVEPDDLIVNSYSLLLGCDKRAFEQENKERHSKDVFEGNFFINWGESCAYITKPGTYFVSVGIRNDYIVVETPQIRNKTAIGRIKSNELKIVVE